MTPGILMNYEITDVPEDMKEQVEEYREAMIERRSNKTKKP
jgi:hypothetical protein